MKSITRARRVQTKLIAEQECHQCSFKGADSVDRTYVRWKMIPGFQLTPENV